MHMHSYKEEDGVVQNINNFDGRFIKFYLTVKI